jgi:UDP-N-acetylmuramoyl-tripeptide--D-alanyl-D-alanine ligase
MRVGEVLEATGATLVRGDPARLVDGISTDTRSLRPRQLFLALSGPNFDGNQFAAKASDIGAGALMLRGGPGAVLPAIAGDAPVCLHASPHRALIDLAAWQRSRLSIPVIGITGSSGKTSTKEILAQLLAPHLRAVSSPRSFNNEIGVPHTLMLAEADTEALVVEMGTNHPGEIAGLCRIARPTAGIVTNVGPAHLDGLGSVEGVAREKAALLMSVPRSGFCVVNLDSPHAELLQGCAAAPVITVSVDGRGAGRGDLNATGLDFHPEGTRFELDGRELRSPLLGVHNVHNLLCALAACRGLGLDLDRVVPAVAELATASGRMRRIDAGPISVLDDSYNANPASTRAGLEVLCAMPGPERRVLVFGDMLELGERSPELHHAVGREAAELGVDCLLTIGKLTRATAAGALETGANIAVEHLGGIDEALERVGAFVRAGDCVMVKGSNAMGLRRVVERLIAQFEEA